MAEQTLIQFRADKELKEEVAAIYEAIGMDLPTAFRMFLLRSKACKGLPFPAVLPETTISNSEAVLAFEALRNQAADTKEMSLDEINKEIAEARANKRK